MSPDPQLGTCQTIESRLAEVTRQRDEAIRLLRHAVDDMGLTMVEWSHRHEKKS